MLQYLACPCEINVRIIINIQEIESLLGLIMLYHDDFCVFGYKRFGFAQKVSQGSQKHVHYIQNYVKVWNHFGWDMIKVRIFLESHNNLKKIPPTFSSLLNYVKNDFDIL